jgi:hypothetical protein
MSVKDTRATGGAFGGAAAKKLRTFKAPVIRGKVTEEMILNAVRGNSGWCMVSVAVKAAAPWATHISSDLQTIRVTDPTKGLRYVYLTPRMAQNALIKFDQGKQPEPFDFALRGGSTHTSYKRAAPGSTTQKAVHKLGRRRIIPTAPSSNDVPSTVGGAVPPRVARTVRTQGIGLKHAAPMGTYRREFGVRAYVGGFEDKMPVGAPSISDK